MASTGAPMNEQTRQRRIRRVLLIEGLSDIFFLIVKLTVGLQTGSVAILSDAVHSLTDLTNNIIGLVLLRMAGSPPDRGHPYGHRKYEALAVFAIAVVIALMAVQVFIRAVTGATVSIDQSPVGLLLMVVVLTINVGFTAWEHRQAALLDSPLLRADATHTLSDVAITIAVIAGWQLAVHGYPWVDSLLAVAVAAFVMWLAWRLFSRSVPVLVDATAIDPERISEAVADIDGVCGIGVIGSHQAGSELLVELVVTVPGEMTTTASHRIADAIEQRIGERFSGVRVQVHIEPAGSTTKRR
jgi:cation diffusion facilitator family transporter